MKRDDIEKIKSSDNWVRIVYQSASSHGYMILKWDLLEMKIKKFDKVFKGCEWHIQRRYQVTMKDIYMSALSTYKKRILTLTTRLNSEYTRTYPDGENILRFKENIRLITLRIQRIERTLNKWN